MPPLDEFQGASPRGARGGSYSRRNPLDLGGVDRFAEPGAEQELLGMVSPAPASPLAQFGLADQAVRGGAGLPGNAQGAVPLPDVYQAGDRNPYVANTLPSGRQNYLNPSTGVQMPLWADDPRNTLSTNPATLYGHINNLVPAYMRQTPAGVAMANEAARDFMGNRMQAGQLQLGQGRLGLDTDIARGAGGIPGSIYNNALEANARALQAQNSPRAEDVAADQAAEASIQNLMRTRGMDEQGAIAEMRRLGQRLPRRLGGLGGQQNQGLPPVPPWVQQPASPAVPPGEVRGGNGPVTSPAPTEVPRPAGGAAGPPVAGLDMNLIGELAARAAGRIPTETTPNGPQRAGYASQPQAYHNAITEFMGGIPDDVLQRNWQAVQGRLLSPEFGGSTAMDTWINTSNHPLSMISGDTRRTNRQVDRVLRMAGMQRSMGMPFQQGTPIYQSIPQVLAPQGSFGIDALRHHLLPFVFGE